ncbi:UNVERIFIED_CONTAM: hypothetical protein Slati_1347700 [Sesamum latifolium]|uniref:Aminotransferase-like plant mobile domain-containing protein n=1 Tax=Sesamum latifolium TaxID=2727402 RepID=A0AAW2XIU4_9LAMI
MASMTASGRRVSLAIPILASIYEGLNTIATSSRLARTSPSFPVHFVYAWLAYYFKTHYPIWQGLRGPKMIRFFGEGGAKYYDSQEARKRIHKAEFVSWACNMIVKNRPFKFIDNGDAEELDVDYFIAIRSSYLTLRQVTSSLLSPTVPVDLGLNLGTFKTPKPTKITIKRKKHEDEQVDGGENNPPHVLVPFFVVKSNSQAVVVEASKGKGPLHNLVDSDSSNKDRHWKRQKKKLAPLKAAEASASGSPREEFETIHSWTMTPPFGMGLKGKQLPQLLQYQYKKVRASFLTTTKSFFKKMWSDLLVKISNTPIDFLSSIEDDVYLIFEPMKNSHKFDITKVEESLNTFFVKVCAYDEARSLSSQKLFQSLHEQHLKEAKACLQDVQAKESEGASKVQSIVNELEHVEKEIVALKGRRTSLCAALKKPKQLNHDAQTKVHEVEEDIATLDNTAPLDGAIVEDSKANLEIFKEDLKSLKPFA